MKSLQLLPREMCIRDRDRPEKSLLRPVKKTGGRNNTGKMTMRYIGGGHKQKYRVVDFKRDKDNIPAKVASIEYDPNRTARIALLVYADGEKRYIRVILNRRYFCRNIAVSYTHLRD